MVSFYLVVYKENKLMKTFNVPCLFSLLDSVQEVMLTANGSQGANSRQGSAQYRGVPVMFFLGPFLQQEAGVNWPRWLYT